MPADYSWSWEPGVLIALVAGLTLYAARWRAVRRQEGPRGASGWRLASFLAGLTLVFVALISPVDSLGERLALVHMVQHILLVDLAPILLILGLTRMILRPVTRRVHRIERAAGPLAHPAVAVALYAGLLWLWHVPALYDAALERSGWHAVEHLCFALAGGLYWWHLLSPIRSRFPLAGVGPIIYMASTKLTAGLLGILLTFAPSVLYAYDQRAGLWGLSAQDDQAVAGLIMALEQSIVMGTALAVLFMRSLSASERDQQRAERYGTT